MSDITWFHEARYGLFIHWGPYSVAARGEWVANRERMAFQEYSQRYAAHFRAENYEPEQWVEYARRWGMKYVILTTRHHDGFCLWDTKTTDFNAVKLGPGRDLLRPLADAVRKAGLKLGFYFSVADWFHPDYPDPHARDWPVGWQDEQARKRFVRYYQSQVRELLTDYGKVDILWYDGALPPPLDGNAINEQAKRLQPHILINDRLGEPFDYRCSEQTLQPKEGPWESCMTLNDNWGYHAGDHQWKNAKSVIKMLITAASNGGNLLINVGPRADGSIPEESVKILDQAGSWLARNGAFLPHSQRSPFTWNHSAMFTVRDNLLFVHLLYLSGPEFCLAEVANNVLSARLLETGAPVPFEQKHPHIWLRDLPFPGDPIATTVVLELEGEPHPISKQQTFWIPQ